MKTIAFYLPQYHNVEENNKWWGEGYTDWNAMEIAKPLYEGHKQPKVPMNQFKYDLEKKETMEWQADLMNKYGVYGIAMYHYWFKDGRKILERPAENLLKWKDINMPFCFYWANESWVRSWSVVENTNIWAANFEQPISPDENGNGVLLEQDYGDKSDWINHFNYFQQFFVDERYIKIDGKPVVMIYRPSCISCLKEMVDCWQECAKEKGWEGIYLIGAYCNDNCKKVFDMQLLHEPGTTIRRNFPDLYSNKNRMEIAKYISYDDVWKKLLNYSVNEENVLFGGFSNYDDTPRRGNAGTVIFNGTAEKFKIYLTELYAKNAAVGNDYIFINAWNEWGEGMCMEPDETEKFGYLEAISYAESHYQEEVYKYIKNESEKEESELQQVLRQKERFDIERHVLNKWLMLKENNINLVDYLIEKGYKNVSIYGYGILGKHLLCELGDSEINVKSVIDRNADGLNLDLPVKKPTDEFEDSELIIVSNIHIYQEIKDTLRKKYKGEIISLEKIIDEAII